jgi:ankyrin repeat domain-containing protein 50
VLVITLSLANLNEENEEEKKEEEKKILERACLRSLSFSNVDDRLHNISLAHADTCNWLFETTQFQRWRGRDDLASHSGVLWIKGKPGAGKSTLMKHTLLYFQERLEDYVIAAYFFNARGSSLEKTPLGMLRSILYQLFDQDPFLRERFIPVYLDKRKKHGQEWEWQLGDLRDFLLSEIKQFECQRKPLLLFIDALDECDELEVRHVVSFLESLSTSAVSSKTLLNICLSSRHYPTISMEKRLELRIDEERGHDQDILLYVQHKLRVRDEEIEKQLLRKAAHVFMWVVLVIEMLNQAFDEGEVRAMKKKLDEVPSDLDEVFSNLLIRDNPNKQRTVLVLQWVLFATRLLTLEELYLAVVAGTETVELGALDRSKDTPEMIERFITSSSKGLIEVSNRYTRTVQFIHESVNDFLLRNKRLQTLDRTLEPHTVGTSHDRLVACCMSYIMMKELELLAKDMKEMVWEPSKEESESMEKKLGENPRHSKFDWHSFREEQKLLWWEREDLDEKDKFKRMLEVRFPFLRYASTHILYHAEKAEADCVTQHALVRRLRQPHGEFDLLRNFHNIFARRKWLSRGTVGDFFSAVWSEQYYELVKASALEKKTRFNEQGGLFSTALQAASYVGTSAVVQQLLEKEPDVNAQGGYYGNALQTASYMGNDAIVQQLLEKGAEVNAQGGHYGTALQAASHGGGSTVVQLLLEKGAEVNAQGGCYGTALQAASYRGSSAVVQLLLDKGADVNAQGGCYGTALHAASYVGDDAVVQLLLENGADVNVQGGKYGCALQAASHRGSSTVVKQLLEKGADINAKGGEYGTALQAASYMNKSAVVQQLLEKGADVNAQSGGYRTALRAAACGGSCAVIQQLLEKGVDVNAQGRDYVTALHAASYVGDAAVVRLLLENGADVNAQGGKCGNALQAASHGGSCAVVQQLLEKGADVNAKGGEYGTALQAASYLNKSAVVQQLLEKGAEVNARSGCYSTALQAASYRGNREVVQLLLENGADVNARGGKYGTALQAASHGGSSPVVQQLLEKGADINAQGGQYGSPLQAALKSGHDAIAQLLREAGAVQFPREDSRPQRRIKTTIRLKRDRRAPREGS